MSSDRTEPEMVIPASSHSDLTGCTPKSRWLCSLRTTILTALPLLSFCALSVGALSSYNGTFHFLTAIIAEDAPIFTDRTSPPLVKVYTGSKAIDTHLSALVAFFIPVLDMKNIDLVLFAISGLGQFGAVWTLMLMESMRVGNQGKLVRFVGLAGTMMQNISYMFTAPLYLFLHLTTSPVADISPSTHSSSALLIPLNDLRTLPITVILGYIIPSLLMGLPAPSVVSWNMHQQLIAFWQLFPIWCVLIHPITRSIYPYITSMVFTSNTLPPTPLRTLYLSEAKRTYRFVIALCISTHLPILVLTLLPFSLLTSGPLLSPISACTFTSVFLPYFPTLTYTVSSLAEGIHTFLIYDFNIGSAAFVLWAILLYNNATAEEGNDAKVWQKLGWKVLRWWLLAGPIGVVGILLWERDEAVGQKVKQGI